MDPHTTTNDDSKTFSCMISDEGSEISKFNGDEFYCLDGGFASHLPSHYKVISYCNYTEERGLLESVIY